MRAFMHACMHARECERACVRACVRACMRELRACDLETAPHRALYFGPCVCVLLLRTWHLRMRAPTITSLCRVFAFGLVMSYTLCREVFVNLRARLSFSDVATWLPSPGNWNRVFNSVLFISVVGVCAWRAELLASADHNFPLECQPGAPALANCTCSRVTQFGVSLEPVHTVGILWNPDQADPVAVLGSAGLDQNLDDRGSGCCPSIPGPEYLQCPVDAVPAALPGFSVAVLWKLVQSIATYLVGNKGRDAKTEVCYEPSNTHTTVRLR